MLSTFPLAVTITGAFIGAGFVSGQELWQFFGVFGIWGVWGFVIATIAITSLTYITLTYVKKAKINTFDKVINPRENKIIKYLLIAFEFIFYFCVYIIMTAGVEALTKAYSFSTPVISGIIFCAIVTAISLIGVKGIISTFSATIPLLILSIVGITIYTLSSHTMNIPTENHESNSLISNWLISALVFVSYNFFAGLGVFAAIGSSVKHKSIRIKGAIYSTVFLLVIGISIILSNFTVNAGAEEMPMLSVAKNASPILAVIYAILLTFAMLGAAISSFFPIVELLKRANKNKMFSIFASLVLSAVAVALSLFGFNDLIGTVYPIFGYIGFILIIAIIYNAFKKNR